MFSTPEDAEKAFYTAFENGDYETMEKVWANDDAVVCVHPNAPRLEGREEIMESWRQIFDGDSGIKFELHNVHFVQDGLLSIHLLKEDVTIDEEMVAVIVTTNIYQQTDEGWKMIMHHSSIEPEYDPEYDEEIPITLH